MRVTYHFPGEASVNTPVYDNIPGDANEPGLSLIRADVPRGYLYLRAEDCAPAARAEPLCSAPPD